MSTLFVLGSGTMGSGIAQTGLQHGYDTVLCDVLPSQLERAKAGIEKNLSRQVEKGRITAEDREVMLSRLRLTQNMEEAASADFVIEAIIEKTCPNIPGLATDKEEIAGLLSSGEYACHHSPEYEAAYHPHYRIIAKELLNL